MIDGAARIHFLSSGLTKSRGYRRAWVLPTASYPRERKIIWMVLGSNPGPFGPLLQSLSAGTRKLTGGKVVSNSSRLTSKELAVLMICSKISLFEKWPTLLGRVCKLSRSPLSGNEKELLATIDLILHCITNFLYPCLRFAQLDLICKILLAEEQERRCFYYQQIHWS